MVTDYRDLVVWQRSMELVKTIYILLKRMPREELYVLSDQMRRAAISIPSNIAEGYARMSPRDYARFLNIARGSVFELETQLMICVRLQYLDEEDIKTSLVLCDEISKMLFSMISKL